MSMENIDSQGYGRSPYIYFAASGGECTRIAVTRALGYPSGLMEGDPAVEEITSGPIQCGDNRFSKSADLTGFEPLQIEENDPAMLFSICHAQGNPTRQRGPIFRDQSPAVFPASFEQEVIRSIGVSALMPGGHVLDVDVGSHGSQSVSHTRRDVCVQQQLGLHTRIKE
jgi:hypothetical protein